MSGATVSRSKKWLLGGIAAVAVGAGALVTAGVAGAESTPGVGSAAAPPPGFGRMALLASFSCEDIGKVESWVEQRIATIGADVDTKGSTAWLQAQLGAAQAAGDTAAAEKYQKVLDARAAHPDRWQNVLSKVQLVEQRNLCS